MRRQSLLAWWAGDGSILRAIARTITLAIVVCVVAAVASANELRPETLQSWNSYIQTVNSNMNGRFDGRRAFLWIDERPDQARLVRQGQAVVSPASDENPTIVPHGLIHHWIGAVFVPDVKLG